MFADLFSPASLFGLAGVAFGASWGLMRSRRAIVAVQGACTLAFVLHYLLLGATSGAAMNALTLVQAAIAYSGRRDRLAGAAYWATIPAMAVMTVLTWHGPASLGAAFGLTMATIGRWQTDIVRLRLCFVICTAGWFTHNVLVGSPFGMACDLIGLSANLWGLAQLWLRHRPVPLVAAGSRLALS